MKRDIELMPSVYWAHRVMYL